MSVIEVEGLRKRYGDTVAVDDVSLAVEEGEIFGILGPNGAGKTTIVECIEGLRRPDAGSVRVLGLDPWADAARLRPLVGAQLQESRLPGRLRVGEALALYRSFYADGADPGQLLEDLELADKARTAFEDLSGGQQQRLSIALALVGNPRIAVLDELTTGLDPQARRDTWELIERVRDSGVTVVLVSHFMEEAERLCDRLAVIDRGRVVATDTPAGLVEHLDREERISFQTSQPFDERLVAELPEVSAVVSRAGEITVTGTGNVLVALATTLADNGIAPVRLRHERANLDDAFLALTGRAMDKSHDRRGHR